MAYQTGTATSSSDLLSKIIAFAVSGGGWTNLGTASGQTTGTWLRGPGLTATENIYAGLQLAEDVPADTYGIQLIGSQGFLAANSFTNQPGTCTSVYSSTWNTTMPYWIVANGQRVIVVWKVSTTYHAMHFGKIFPYATPSEYAYPVYIAGEDNVLRRWSYQNQSFRHFVDPGYNGANWFAFPDGGWQTFRNVFDQSGSESADVSYQRYVWPYSGAHAQNGGNTTFSLIRATRENIDGTYTLLPIVLHAGLPSVGVFGDIDGAFYVSGTNNAAENIITIAGQDYLAVQNIYRNGRHHYWALKLA